MEGIGNFGMAMPLSMVGVVYNIFHQDLADPDLNPAQELNPVLKPIWDQSSLATTYPLDPVLALDEAILEALNGLDKPWDDLHHRSYFLPELRRIEVGQFCFTVNGDRSCPFNPLAMHTVYAKGNYGEYH
jgi:hypothetical protein